MPNKAFVFDCDGTLSQLEGINVLAKWNNVATEVETLTEHAMGQSGMSPEVYQARLDLVRPTRAQLEQLGADYYAERAQDIDALLTKLTDYTVYIVSAGMNPSVDIFAHQLGIQHVFAVDLSFDATGNYRDFDHHSPMTQNGGKRQVIHQLREQHDFIGYIGDGMNDVKVKDLVDVFIGYGGVYPRERIANACDIYLRNPSMLQVLDYLGASNVNKR